jgi:hypothetical protein
MDPNPKTNSTNIRNLANQNVNSPRSRGPGSPQVINPNKSSEAITKNERQLIITSKTQTGEVYQVAAALALDPNTDVLVLDKEVLADNDPLLVFFQQAADSKIGERVRKLGLPQSKILYEALTNNYKIKNSSYDGYVTSYHALAERLSQRKSVGWIFDPQGNDGTRQVICSRLDTDFRNSILQDHEDIRYWKGGWGEYLINRIKVWNPISYVNCKAIMN